MKFAPVAVVGLAFVASCLALPVDMNVGLDLTPGSVNAWQKEIVVQGQPIQLGFGWNEAGILSAGAKLLVAQSIPISAAISTNINDMDTLKYQAGAGMGNTVSGIVYGDMKEGLQYQIDANVPIVVDSGRKVTSLAATLEGSGLKPTALTGGLQLGNDVIRGRLGFNDNMMPSTFKVGLGAAME